jgi:hypothetical protein
MREQAVAEEDVSLEAGLGTCQPERMTCLHPKDLDDRHEGLAIDSANRQNRGRAAARQHHRDELQRQRTCDCVSDTVATSISIVLVFYHCVHCKAEVANCWDSGRSARP